MEVHRSHTRNHHRAPRIGSGAARSWNHEDRSVDKSPTKVSEAFLPLLLTLLFGRADLGATVSGGGRGGITDWLNGKRTHNERAEVVGGAHTSRPAWRR